jgi:hypothetical protein
MICSEFVSKCWEHGGKIWPMLDTADIMPSNLGEWLVPKPMTARAKGVAGLRKIFPQELDRYVYQERVNALIGEGDR